MINLMEHRGIVGMFGASFCQLERTCWREKDGGD